MKNKKNIVTIEKSKAKARGAVALFKKRNSKMHNREMDTVKGRGRTPKYKKSIMED